jgi:hypothetical protein
MEHVIQMFSNALTNLELATKDNNKKKQYRILKYIEHIVTVGLDSVYITTNPKNTEEESTLEYLDNEPR